MASGDMLITEGATIAFTQSTYTPTPEVTIDLDGFGTSTGRVSPPSVLTSDGDGVGPGLYRWGFRMELTGTEQVGREARLYLGYSDGTNDFNISQTAATYTPESKTLGAHYLGCCVCNETSIGTPTFTAFGWVVIPVPQVQLLFWNDTGLTTSTANHQTSFS